MINRLQPSLCENHGKLIPLGKQPVQKYFLRNFTLVTALLLIASLSWSGTTAAEICSSNDYELSTQAEVDALGAAGCDIISGYLYIRSSTDITNLNGLANITSVGWSLEIWHNDALVNLDGLANITSVGGSLVVSENNVLTNLDGLANITSVSWGLQINENPALTNLDGLANIPSVGGDLRIFFNSALNNLDGLSNITSVRGDLSIDSNREIINLDGLANITSVGGDLYIGNNDALARCEGVALLLGWPSGPPEDGVDGTIYVGRNSSGCNSIAAVLSSYIPPSISRSFNALLQAVQNVRGAGSSQQQATSDSSANAGVARELAKREGAAAQSKTAAATREPASIPAMPNYLMLIMSCLVGLLGLRRLRA